MNVKELIPQREPFLFIDEIINQSENTIITKVTFNEDRDFFKGHFPGNPIVPGVILSEHCFQSGAALMTMLDGEAFTNKTAVVSRIRNCKFKKLCPAGTVLTTETILVESLQNAHVLKSNCKDQNGNKVLSIDFVCSVVENQ